MPEATIEKRKDGTNLIICGTWSLAGNALLYCGKNVYPSDSDLDDLYAVLHARHVAQHYDSEIMKRIGEAVEDVKDDELYGGEG